MTLRYLLVVLLVPAGIPAATTRAAGEGLSIDGVQVGLAGAYELGTWTPVRFTLHAGDSAWRGGVRLSAPDGDDVLTAYASAALDNLSLEAGATREAIAYVRIGRQDAALRIVAANRDEATDDVARTIQLPPALLASGQHVLVVGNEIDLPQATRLFPRQSGEEIVGSHLADLSQLPDRWYGYDGVDILILTTSSQNAYNDLTAAQRDALLLWVRLGGRVLLSVGARGAQCLAGGRLIAELAPGQFDETLPLSDTHVLEKFAESSQPIDADEDGRPRPPPLYTRLSAPQGEVLLDAGRDRPVIIRAAYGFGQVLFVGLDLDAEPVIQWRDRGRFTAKLLEALIREAATAESQQAGGEAVHLGFDDLSGQLRAALEQFEGVRLIQFSWVAALVVVYILLIGPLDYWLVSRLLRRRQLTWLTSAATMLAFCALAWWLAAASRGPDVRVNQVDVVDWDAASGLARGTSWLHVYSPGNRQFDLALSPQAAIEMGESPPGVLFAWQGLPGGSLGGMNRTSRVAPGGGEYTVVDLSSASAAPRLVIEGLPISAGGSKSLAARWWAAAPPAAARDLYYTGGQKLKGELENPFSVRLTNCLLFHERWVYRLGNLEPGQRVELDEASKVFVSEWVLTERKVVEAREVSPPWDRAMRDDVPKIVRMMMLHEAATGRKHTSLLHRQCGFIDISGHLSLDRAVLVGAAAAPAAQLTSAGAPLDSNGNKHWTFYRAVFPTAPLERD